MCLWYSDLWRISTIKALIRDIHLHEERFLKLDPFSQNDRMAADMAVELKKQNVACISLWPGPVRTELIQEMVLDKATEGEQVIFDMKLKSHFTQQSHPYQACSWSP